MKILGIDYGDRRTGVAISDSSLILASNYTTIESGHAPKVCDEIMEIVKKEDVEKLVLGLPLNMDGSEGPRAEKTRIFAAMLAEKFDGEIILRDERLTTVSAAYFLNETDKRGKKRKALVDRIAASIILQSYLDFLKS